MKIYIYNDLITSQEASKNNLALANLNNLFPHLQYLIDVYHECKTHETNNPLDADYYLVPIFLTGFQFANINPENIITNHCKHLYRGNHILVATGDFGQRSETQHEMPESLNPIRAYNKRFTWLDDRFILVALEATKSLHQNDITFLPYQHIPVFKQNKERDFLLSFMGKLIQPYLPATHIRGGCLNQLKEVFNKSEILIGTPEQIRSTHPDVTDYHQLMSRSIFTLCPAGYGRWTFRFVEALLNGSIPILVSDDYVLPFSKEIEWGKYCYQLKEADLLNLPSFINKLSIAEIYQKQRNINQDQHLFEKPYSLKHIINSLESKVNHKSISPAERAIAKMRSPSRMHIICIDVTNKCDLSCSNCTRLLKYQDSLWEMTPDNFRIALKSLTGYTGIIAMIGGNPCTHSKFEQLCQIFEEEIPNRAQRGLWTNNIFKHRIIIEKTFGAFNLNPHNEPRAIDQLTDLYNNMVVKRKFNGALHTGHSHHAPLLTAVKDLYSEELMWQKISCCDVNREWSAAIVQNNGELRAYFCEVAASFDLARAQDNGLPVIPGWWQNPIQTYGTQVKHFCPGCGVPARLKGHNDHEQTDTYTVSNADLAEKANRRKNRNVILLSQDNQNELTHKVTHYSQQAQ